MPARARRRVVQSRQRFAATPEAGFATAFSDRCLRNQAMCMCFDQLPQASFSGVAACRIGGAWLGPSPNLARNGSRPTTHVSLVRLGAPRPLTDLRLPICARSQPGRRGACGCGGTGRRTGFRFQSPQGVEVQVLSPAPARRYPSCLGTTRYERKHSRCRSPKPSMKA